MIIWQQGEFQPNTVKFSQASNYSKLDLQNEPIFDLTFWKYKDDLIDPFQEQNNILMPLIISITNGIQDNAKSLLGNLSKSTYGSDLIQLKDLKLIHNVNYQNDPRTEVMIVVIKCEKQYLKLNQTCASDDIIQSYNNQGPNHVTFSIYMKTYNKAAGFSQERNIHGARLIINVPDIGKHQIIIYYYQRWFAFSESQYVDDVSFISQSLSSDYGKQFMGIDSQFSFMLRLDPIYTQNIIRYLNIGEILAMVGSIVSVLMSLGIAIQQINKYCLQNYLNYQVLNQYMPSQFQRNIFGKIFKIKALTQQQSNRVIPQLIEIAQRKFDIINLVYQISRIELFLIKNFGKSELLKANQYELKLEQQDQESQSIKQESFSINDIELFTYTFHDNSTVVKYEINFKKQLIQHTQNNNFILFRLHKLIKIHKTFNILRLKSLIMILIILYIFKNLKDNLQNPIFYIDLKPSNNCSRKSLEIVGILWWGHLQTVSN
ncbi:hypothetical protein pb186bvf_013542 [Paramecium bursaria]